MNKRVVLRLLLLCAYLGVAYQVEALDNSSRRRAGQNAADAFSGAPYPNPNPDPNLSETNLKAYLQRLQIYSTCPVYLEGCPELNACKGERSCVERWHEEKRRKEADALRLREEQQKAREREQERQAAEREKFKQEALAQRDPTDVVAQVLNYTTFGSDEGSDNGFWWKDATKGECIYRQYKQSSWIDALSEASRAQDRMASDFQTGAAMLNQSAVSGNEMVLDLNELDPKNISFVRRSVLNYQKTGYTELVDVTHEGRYLLSGSTNTDLDRLGRGWMS